MKETTAIQQTQPPSEFAQLLESGRILDALEYRAETLEEIAANERGNCTAAKLMSLAAIAGSIPLLAVAVPGVPLVAGLAGFLYAKTVWDDWQNSKKLCLLPGSRAGLFDMFSAVGLAAEKQEGSSADHEDEIVDFLSLQQAYEFKLLGHFEPQLADLLQKLAPQDRVSGYRHILRRAGKQGSLPGIQDVKAAIAGTATDSAPSTQLQQPTTASIEASKEGDRHSVSLALNPEINVHNHLGRYTSAQKAASPGQAYRQVEAPDLSIYSEPDERMKALLKSMAQSGFPLGKLLNQPFVWAWGRSQSGKTTIALLLALSRIALGHKVGYFTTDDDYPRQVRWARVEDSAEGYAVGLDEARDTLSNAGKGALAGNSWLFDEMFAASAEHGISIQPLLTTVLMKGAKTKGCVIGISQADTSTAHGLKGIDAAWRIERVSIEAIHEEDDLGQRSPTGRYLVSKGNEEGTEEWTLPEWMLTELNQWGSPDPVVWLLNRFPELCYSMPAKTEPVEMEIFPEAEDYVAPQVERSAEHRDRSSSRPSGSFMPWSVLPEPMQEVLKFSAGYEQVLPSEVQAGCRAMREKTSDEIIQVFKTLEALQLGSTLTSQRSIRFKVSESVRVGVMSELV